MDYSKHGDLVSHDLPLLSSDVSVLQSAPEHKQTSLVKDLIKDNVIASLTTETTSTFEPTLREVATIDGNSSLPPKEADYDDAGPTDALLEESKLKEYMDVIDVVFSSPSEENIKGDAPPPSYPVEESEQKAEQKVSAELLDVNEESISCKAAKTDLLNSPPKDADNDYAAPVETVLKCKPGEDVVEILEVKEVACCDEIVVVGVDSSLMPDDCMKGGAPTAIVPLEESNPDDADAEKLTVKDKFIPREASIIDVVLNPQPKRADNDDAAPEEVGLTYSKLEQITVELLDLKEATFSHEAIVIDVFSDPPTNGADNGEATPGEVGLTDSKPEEQMNVELLDVKEASLSHETIVVDVFSNPPTNGADNGEETPGEVGLTDSKPEEQMNIELLDVKEDSVSRVTAIIDVFSYPPPEGADNEDAAPEEVWLSDSKLEPQMSVELIEVKDEPKQDVRNGAHPVPLEEFTHEEQVGTELFDVKTEPIHYENATSDAVSSFPPEEKEDNDMSPAEVMLEESNAEKYAHVELLNVTGESTYHGVATAREGSVHHNIPIVDAVSTPSPEEADNDNEPPTLILPEDCKPKKFDDIHLSDVREESTQCEVKIVQVISILSHRENNSDDTEFLLKESTSDKQDVSAFTDKEESASFECNIDVAPSPPSEVLPENHGRLSALGLLKKSTHEEEMHIEINAKENYDTNKNLPLALTTVADECLEENILQKKSDLPQHELHDHSTEKLEIKDQGIPQKTDGTYRYDRSFLIAMRSQEVCLKKPEGLPDIQIVKHSVGELKLSESITNEQVHSTIRSSTLLPAELQRKLEDILACNQKKQQTLDMLVEQVSKLNINTAGKLQGTTTLIFAKAIEDPSLSPVCVSLCRCLDLLKVPVGNRNVNFRKLLKKKCTKLMIRDKTEEMEINQLMIESDTAKTEEGKKKLKKDYLDAKRKGKERFLRSLRFIRDLFTSKLIDEYMMHYYLNKLLSQEDEESLEHLCHLLIIIGRAMDLETDHTGNTHNKTKMDGHFNQMLDIVNKKQASSRTQAMLQHVIDLRLNNWIPCVEEKIQKPSKQVAKEDRKKTVGSQVQNPVSFCAPSENYNKQEKVRSRVQDSVGKEERKNIGCIDAKLSLNKENAVNFQKMPVHPGVNDRIGNGILPLPISWVAFPSARTTVGAQTAASAQPLLGVSGRSSSNVKKMSGEGANHRETSLPKALLKAANGANSRVDAQRDRLELFGEYMADLLKDVSEQKRRKCQNDVLKVINAYADGCSVKIDVV